MVLKTTPKGNTSRYRGHFEPADREEHERGNNGEDVSDYCANCHQPFMAHNNGQCPRS